MSYLYPSFWKRTYEFAEEFIETVSYPLRLSFSTQLQGGYSSSEMVLPGPSNISMVRYRTLLGTHIVLFDDFGRRNYEGRVQEVSKDDDGILLKADGYYVHGNEEYSEEYIIPFYELEPYTLSQVIHDVIEFTHGSTIDTKIWKQKFAFVDKNADTDITGLGEDVDYRYTKLVDILEDSMKLGYKETDARPVNFVIYNNRVPLFYPEPDQIDDDRPPYFNTWMIKEENLVEPHTPTRSRTELFNKMFGTFESELGPIATDTVMDEISIALLGPKEGSVSAGQLPMGMAEALRDIALERYRYPLQIHDIEIGGIITHESGVLDYPYRIRAGDRIMLVDSDPNLVIVHDKKEHDLHKKDQASAGIIGIVVQTSYSNDTGTIQIEVGTKDTRFEMYLIRLGLSGSIS